MDTGMDALVQGITTGITSIGADIMGALGDIVPVALPIAGGIIVVTLGLKVFRRVAN